MLLRFLPLAAMLFVGCRTEEPPQGEPFAIDLPTGPCGTEPHDWVDPARLGEIVSWEKLPDASLSASAIDGLLGLAGVSGFSPVPYDVVTYRVRYLTQDRGELVETTGLLSWPVTDDATPVPTMVWPHPTVGFSDDCAPTGDGQIELQVPSILLASLGYGVAAPDYLGMNGWGEPSDQLHPYLVPEPTAVATLDAVRALWRFQEDTGVVVPSEDAGRAVLIGASEGGFAALWADRYAAGYLPELDIVGTVAAVPPTDVAALSRHAVTVPSETTVGMLGFVAGASTWHGVGPLSDVLTDDPPYALASILVDDLEHFCDGQSTLLGIDPETLTIADIYAPDFVDALDTGTDFPPWTCLTEASTLRLSEIERGHDAPVFMVVGERDDLVNGAIERADAGRLCEAGYRIEYLECDESTHVEAAAYTLPQQIQWAMDRLNGAPADGATCAIGEPVSCAL